MILDCQTVASINMVTIRSKTMGKNLSFKNFLITEMALHDYKTVGDFSKNSSFRDPRDRMLIQHPKSIERTRTKFANTEWDFDFYFVNNAKANKHTEVGLVKPEWVRDNLGDEVYNTISPNMEQDHIQVIFTNNKGSERKNLTSWMMAHRIFHALARNNGMRTNHLYKDASDALISQLSGIMQYYGDEQFPDSERKLTNTGYDEHSRGNSRTNQLAMTYFFQQVCTFRSARESLIRDWFEVMHELGAQYLTTGKIKFNPAPQCFGNKSNGKNGYRKCIKSKEDIDEVNDALDTLSRDIIYYFDNMLGATVNAILVM